MFGAIGNCFRFVIVIACLIALILQIMIIPSCDFVSKESEKGDSSINFGLWKAGLNGQCLDRDFGVYVPDNLMLMNARNTLITSIIAGALGLLMVLLELTKCRIFCGFFVENFLFTIAWINASTVYMVFGMTGCGNYFDVDTWQQGLDNMTLVADTLAKMDESPNSNFTLPNNDLKEQLDSLVGQNKINLTDIIPEFVEEIPFGTKCSWGTGCTYNLLAIIVYFACGVLLCITPKASPIWGSQIEDEEDLALTPSIKESQKGSTKLSTGESDWSTGENPNAKIV